MVERLRRRLGNPTGSTPDLEGPLSARLLRWDGVTQSTRVTQPDRQSSFTSPDARRGAIDVADISRQARRYSAAPLAQASRNQRKSQHHHVGITRQRDRLYGLSGVQRKTVTIKRKCAGLLRAVPHVGVRHSQHGRFTQGYVSSHRCALQRRPDSSEVRSLQFPIDSQSCIGLEGAE